MGDLQRSVEAASAGHEFVLGGRYVFDEDGFYCAIGEAVNGPGGYFGWNLDALVDCLRGGWGAVAPFVLRWASSAVARTWMVKQVPGGDGGSSLSRCAGFGGHMLASPGGVGRRGGPAWGLPAG
ncbi:barstar family protein [Kribbella sp. CA-253562]|uniref:barstar family protein n=1 Tax=Kribbella sp. CA-253562 TaxID=3239942 RepID=UPI003D92A72F